VKGLLEFAAMAEPIQLSVPEGSPEPRIRISRHFVKPFNTVLMTARTCYSSKGWWKTPT
jgi:hypothetical protein